MEITQRTRLVRIDSPLGEDVLALQTLEGEEELGRPFLYELQLVSENPALNFDRLLGKPLSLALELPGGGTRPFHGIVSRFAQTAGSGQFAGYRVTLQPWLWLLTRTSDCRIFQNRSVPEIVKQVFRDLGFSDFEDALSRTYRAWEYCVQYRETSFDFVSRLLEQEGIYYYFRHERNRHVLVLADAAGAHACAPGYACVPYYPPTGEQRERDHIYDWHLAREVQPGSLALNDYDFQRPGASLEVRASQPRAHDNGAHPLFDYPGEYVQGGDGEHYARTRLEAIQTACERLRLRGNARGLGCGQLFELNGCARTDRNREYLIVAARYRIVQERYESGEPENASQFDSALECLDADQAFHPLPSTPRPIVQGPQTARVVGPAGEEIWTDQYGRVKVHFHWDRHDRSDENSSCWIRVSQAWAGKNWGAIQIPRIGQEVIVSFLEGDPDRPIITGRVYNAEQTVPYALPANATQNGIKSRSSKGGGPANFNEIRMEDRKGAEQLYIHAEKNQDIEVENDESHSVGHDRSKSIGNDETVQVGRHRTERVGLNETLSIGANRTEDVAGNESIAILGNRTISVSQSETAAVALQRTHTVGINETIAIGAAQEIAIGAYQALNIGASQEVSVGANRTETVGADADTQIDGDESRRVGQGRSTDVGQNDSLEVGRIFALTAGDAITLTTGAASITLKKDGTIVLRGKDITLDGSGAITIRAGQNVVIKGQKILQN